MWRGIFEVLPPQPFSLTSLRQGYGGQEEKEVLHKEFGNSANSKPQTSRSFSTEVTLPQGDRHDGLKDIIDSPRGVYCNLLVSLFVIHFSIDRRMHLLTKKLVSFLSNIDSFFSMLHQTHAPF